MLTRSTCITDGTEGCFQAFFPLVSNPQIHIDESKVYRESIGRQLAASSLTSNSHWPRAKSSELPSILGRFYTVLIGR